MDKRKARNLGGLVGCLAVTALVGCGLYYGKSGARSYIDGGSSSSAGQATSVTNSDGTLAIAAPQGPLFASAAGNTLQLTATISPSNVSDKRVAWTSSDTSKVSLNSATTQSGSAVVASLVAVYSSYVTITATAYSNSSATLSIKLWCSNELNTGVDDASFGACGVDGKLIDGTLTADGSSLVYGAGATYVAGGAHGDFNSSGVYSAAATNAVIGSAVGCYVYPTLTGVDGTRLPTVFDSLGLKAGTVAAMPSNVVSSSLYTFQGADSSGVYSDLDKANVRVLGDYVTVDGQVLVRLIVEFLKYVSGYLGQIVSFGTSVKVAAYLSEYVAPASLAGDSAKTF